ncbi:MAG: hypothetical protein ACRDTJ_30260 [Pseudonocardiaceae bacterium]
MSVPEMVFGGDPPVHERPYRPYLYPPEPVRRRRIVTTKDEVQVLEDGTEIRLPVEERPAPKTITRITTFGVEHVEEDNR